MIYYFVFHLFSIAHVGNISGYFCLCQISFLFSPQITFDIH